MPFEKNELSGTAEAAGSLRFFCVCTSGGQDLVAGSRRNPVEIARLDQRRPEEWGRWDFRGQPCGAKPVTCWKREGRAGSGLPCPMALVRIPESFVANRRAQKVGESCGTALCESVQRWQELRCRCLQARSRRDSTEDCEREEAYLSSRQSQDCRLTKFIPICRLREVARSGSGQPRFA